MLLTKVRNLFVASIIGNVNFSHEKQNHRNIIGGIPKASRRNQNFEGQGLASKIYFGIGQIQKDLAEFLD